jgi:subtilisin family serine protease
MDALQLVRLAPLMSRSEGRPEVAVALIDGPVALDHPDLAQSRMKEIPGAVRGSCSRLESVACMHGTFVAGMLVARRGSQAPSICPGCTLILRPIFPESTKNNHSMPSASPEELAKAITETIGAGAKVINLSAAVTNPSSRGEHQLGQALDYAAQRSVLVVAAAGNQSTVGSSAITRHPWVIPVTGCDSHGRPTRVSNLGSSIGRAGLAAPGENIVSLGADGQPQTSAGTSAAAPFVTGAIALLWSEFPKASAAQVKLAVTQAGRPPRRAIAPPLLDAWAAYEALSRN